MPKYNIGGKVVRSEKPLSDAEIDEIAGSMSKPAKPAPVATPEQPEKSFWDDLPERSAKLGIQALPGFTQVSKMAEILAPQFTQRFGETFKPVKAVTQEGILPQVAQYGYKKATGAEFEAPPKTKELNWKQTLGSLYDYAVQDPGGFTGIMANAIVADPELMFTPNLVPARVLAAVEKATKTGKVLLSAADAGTQAAAIAGAQSIATQLNHTGTVDMSRVAHDAGVGFATTAAPVVGGQAIKAGAGKLAEKAIGSVQPHYADLARKMEAKGYILEPAQVRADKPLGTPGFRTEDRINNENLATREASSETGATTENITPSFIKSREDELGKNYDTIFGRKFDINSNDASTLSGIVNFVRRIDPAGGSKVSSAAANLVGRWNKEYQDALVALINANAKKYTQRTSIPKGMSAPSWMARSGFKNARKFDSGTAPEWAEDTEKMITELTQKMGLKGRPEIYYASPWSEGLYGLASPADNIIVIHDGLNRNDALSTILHEYGHQAQFQLFENATREEKLAVVEAYTKQKAETPRGQTIQFHRPYTAAKYGPSATQVAGRKFEENYLFNFPEWFAEQTSRWITQTRAPTTVVEKFFKKAADVWKKIYETAGRYLPLTREMDAFFRNYWKGDNLGELFKPAPASEILKEGAVIDPSALLDPSTITASIDGRELQRIRSALRREARTNVDGNIRRDAAELVNQIDSMIGRDTRPRSEFDNMNISDFLAQTNRRYAATSTLSEGIRKGFVSGGKVSPEGLGKYLSGDPSRARGYGNGTSKHPLYDLGYAGEKLKIRSRAEGAEIPDYGTGAALYGRAKQFLGSMVGGRTQLARDLQRQFLTPGQPPLGIGEGLNLYPYLGTLSQQATTQELARKLKESRRRRG